MEVSSDRFLNNDSGGFKTRIMGFKTAISSGLNGRNKIFLMIYTKDKRLKYNKIMLLKK